MALWVGESDERWASMISANPEYHRSFGLPKRFRARVLSPFILGIFRHPGNLGAAPHTFPLFRTVRHRSTFSAAFI